MTATAAADARQPALDDIHLAAALADRVHATTGIEYTLALWRHKAMSATIQFLDDMTQQTEPASTERLEAWPQMSPSKPSS